MLKFSAIGILLSVLAASISEVENIVRHLRSELNNMDKNARHYNYKLDIFEQLENYAEKLKRANDIKEKSDKLNGIMALRRKFVSIKAEKDKLESKLEEMKKEQEKAKKELLVLFSNKDDLREKIFKEFECLKNQNKKQNCLSTKTTEMQNTELLEKQSEIKKLLNTLKSIKSADFKVKEEINETNDQIQNLIEESKRVDSRILKKEAKIDLLKNSFLSDNYSKFAKAVSKACRNQIFVIHLYSDVFRSHAKAKENYLLMRKSESIALFCSSIIILSFLILN